MLPDQRRSTPSESRAEEKLGPGGLVIVVGPSGAGKDSLIDGFKADAAGHNELMFVKRLITRPAEAGSEDHEEVGYTELEAMIKKDEVALSWAAHNLLYALPKSVDAHIAAGGVAIANGSRRIIPYALLKYEHVLVVHITAPVEVLAERLAQRGRETAEDIANRLKRAEMTFGSAPNVARIENVGSIEEGVRKLSEAISTFYAPFKGQFLEA
ncbi:phosphonate metabolism protein/1,5-bisphosphokinase (PRPP-forming) PhnN [Pseudovibrio exalbescens]|uniref:phosphonate metabolism protein/1,5-bisphosphokinase (PRPP-forming) PhnN n=1 Tax=Pseudovibrio exalbescens TaxID=197461 RepID=UPI00236502F0|nr:phosphonate metabolism protein/1,5-bisphosphokinase (PRPP-forming) PhnN [Pseudovibrio exalbescens]MDD7911775.1 phosphonate metabolism protein/1,5-bisphosphokinase (PRPP-forming) PhnN [Pseudovibrio exalbescens]